MAKIAQFLVSMGLFLLLWTGVATSGMVNPEFIPAPTTILMASVELYRDVAIDFQGKIVCGKFIDKERPTFSEMLDEHNRRILGEKYVAMPAEGGMIHG